MSPPQLLIGKTVAITGAATGIGRALAIAISSHGANVSINHLPSQTPLIPQLRNSLHSPSQFLAVPGDISLPETGPELIAATVSKFGKLDVFISNAGICAFHDFLDTPAATYSETVRTNLDGAYYATQAAARQMKAQGTGGSIIAISSISALVGGSEQVHYTPTKAGVLSLMQSAAAALGKYGIRCNAVLPGTVETELNRRDLEDLGKRRYMEGRVPLGRLGVPEDLVGPVVFLASDLAGYVTGAQLLVDGGLFVNLQ